MGVANHLLTGMILQAGPTEQTPKTSEYLIALYSNLLFMGSVGIRSPSIFDGHGNKPGKTHLQTPKSPAQFAWNLQLWVSLVITFGCSDAKSSPEILPQSCKPNIAKYGQKTMCLIKGLCLSCFFFIPSLKLTASLHLKMDGWKISFG